MESEPASSRPGRSPLLGRIPIPWRCWLLAMFAGAPGVLVVFALLPVVAMPFPAKWSIGLAVAAVWLLLAWQVKYTISTPLVLLSSALRSFEEGDYSIQLAPRLGGDSLAETVESVNALGSRLRAHRLRVTETALLLEAVADEIDAAIFTLDADQRISFVNRAGERLLGGSRPTILGKHAKAARLVAFLDRVGATGAPFQEAGTRWDIRRKNFYSEGRQQTLLVVSDLTQPLRQEERVAWQRLIRVLGHEINNSLTPIRSLSSHLLESVEGNSDLRSGLALMSSRSEALARFISGFAQVANVPPPNKTKVRLRPLLERLPSLESRVAVEVKDGPDFAVNADADQIEQVLINLVKNAAEAAIKNSGQVEVSWRLDEDRLDEDRVRISIRDDGPGLGDTQNLFVPFYTTKSGGSGIGLALSRQIVEAHGGVITLRNRADRRGAEAIIELPLH